MKRKQDKQQPPPIIINIYRDDNGYYYQICTDGYIFSEAIGPFLLWVGARDAAHAAIKETEDASTQE